MGLISRVSSRTYRTALTMNNAQQFSKDALFKQLKDSGKLDEFQKHLRKKLIESEWRNVVAKQCDDLIDKNGVENINVDSLVQQVTPTARAKVPDAIKSELMMMVKQFLEESTNV